MLNLIHKYAPAFDHQDNYQRSPLHNAAKSKNFTAIQFLFDHGDKDKFIDLQTMGGVTALMYAAEQGILLQIKFLLEKGPDVLIHDSRNLNALDYA